MLVSIIIPAYNAEQSIVKLLDSISNSELNDYEIICVDDGSTDGTLGKLNDYKKINNHLKIVSQENGGGVKGSKQWFKNC